MDSGRISLCGEESFGTGSDHIREKDGIWAVLSWLSILEFHNRDQTKLVTVEEIVHQHWKTFGRNYYCRYDYEEVDASSAQKVMAGLLALTQKYSEEIKGGKEVVLGKFKLAKADEFSYKDPVDGSLSLKQGLRFLFSDGSRFVFRLSGTGSVGATIRLYLEKYEQNQQLLHLDSQEALSKLVEVALSVSRLGELTGRDKPTVIT